MQPCFRIVLVVSCINLLPALFSSASSAEPGTADDFGIVSDDGRNSLQIGGRIHLDAAMFDEDGSEVENRNTEVRRARLAASGLLHGDFEYKLQFDFAGGETATKDLYIRHQPSNLIVGHFKQPFSLEELTSSNNITFMERALPVGLSASRRLGIGWHFNRDHYTLAATVYDRAADGGTQGSGLGARASWLPWRAASDRFLHLGLAVATEGPGNEDADTFRFRQRPEAHLANRLIDTGTLDGADDLGKLGLEAAWVGGPLSLQAEYIAASASRDGAPDLDIGGYYAYVSYVLTGESRPYSKGAFKGIKPAGDSGAWEIAARYSHLDLDDGDVTGGQEDNFTLGVNYYLNANIRVMANLVLVDVERDGVTHDPRIFQLRGQLTF